MHDWFILTDVLRTSLRLMVPIDFAALGGVICERGGVYNVGMEGMMLSGAFGAALGTFLTGNPVMGVMVGIRLGALCGVILGILSVRLNVNQIVAGIAVNLVALGLTAFLARLIMRPRCNDQDAGGVHFLGCSRPLCDPVCRANLLRPGPAGLRALHAGAFLLLVSLPQRLRA